MVRISDGQSARSEIARASSQWIASSLTGSAVVARLGSAPVDRDSIPSEANAVKKKEERTGDAAKSTEHQPYRVRLPRFITDEDVGLDDVIKRGTYAIGIRPCNGCERRAAALNR